jgi:hypothetical protein
MLLDFIQTALLGYVAYVLFVDRRSTYPTIPDVLDDEEEVGEVEQRLIERDKSFDDRINQMKEELALQQPSNRRGTPAQELHPDVKNLDHDNMRIRVREDHTVEVAE